MKDNAVTKRKLKKSDQVQIIAGKAKGKKGKIIRFDEEGRAYLEGINMVKKAVKKRKQNQQHGIVEVEAPIDISNLAIVCKKCGPTRIGYKMEKDNKIRICRKCGEQL